MTTPLDTIRDSLLADLREHSIRFHLQDRDEILQVLEAALQKAYDLGAREKARTP